MPHCWFTHDTRSYQLETYFALDLTATSQIPVVALLIITCSIVVSCPSWTHLFLWSPPIAPFPQNSFLAIFFCLWEYRFSWNTCSCDCETAKTVSYFTCHTNDCCFKCWFKFTVILVICNFPLLSLYHREACFHGSLPGVYSLSFTDTYGISKSMKTASWEFCANAENSLTKLSYFCGSGCIPQACLLENRFHTFYIHFQVSMLRIATVSLLSSCSIPVHRFEVLSMHVCTRI